MPNDLINALLGQQTEVPRGPSPFGAEPPRPEDAISGMYRSNAPSSWLHDLAMKTMPGPQTGSIAQDVAGSIPFASLGLSPTVKFHYTSQGRPMTQSQGRIVSQNRPIPPHPATDLAPAISTGQAASNIWSNLEDQNPAAKGMGGISGPSGDSFNSRFGGMAPPSQEMPPPESLYAQSGKFMPQSGQFDNDILAMGKALPTGPMPRPSPFQKQTAVKTPPKNKAPEQRPYDWRRGGMMHMEQGGLNPDGRPMVVGEDGPEVVVPNGPSAVVPNNLAVQSGMIDAPTGGFPETGIERRSRKSKEFEGTLKGFLSSPANLLSLAGPAGAVAATAMENQDKSAMSGQQPLSSSKPKLGQAIAGFSEPRPELPKDVQAKLNSIKSEIEQHNTTVARHAALKDAKPALYASRTAGALSALQRLTQEQNAIEGPHDKNVEAWQQRLNDFMTKQHEALFQRQQKEADATTSFQTKNPNWGNEAPKWGAGVEGTLGAITGLASKGSLAKKLLKGGLAGMGTGALLSATPNLIDAGNLPLGSQEQKDAFWNMLTPDMATKVVSDAALGGGIGAASTYGSSTIKDGVNALVKLLKGPATRAPRISKSQIPPPPTLAASPTPAKSTRKKSTK